MLATTELMFKITVTQYVTGDFIVWFSQFWTGTTHRAHHQPETLQKARLVAMVPSSLSQDFF